MRPASHQPLEALDLHQYVARSGVGKLARIRWEEVNNHPVSPEAIRTLRYMQDTETHTIIYLRELLSTRAVDDPVIASFLACWFYEETFHGDALGRFLTAAGCSFPPRRRSQTSVRGILKAMGIRLVSRNWVDFVAVHMAWGAINEITAATAYRRLAILCEHPVLAEILAVLTRDEARHFSFYARQAERRLMDPRTASITRSLIERFWQPVGSGVQPPEETRFMARYLFSGLDGRIAARKIDSTIRRLPGFAGMHLFESWIESHP